MLKRMFKRLMLIGSIAFVVLLLWTGPGWLYGRTFARRVSAAVQIVEPFGVSDDAQPEAYIVELHTGDGRAYTFTSTDPMWILITPGNRVLVKLYPRPPWSDSNGIWSDAMLLAKIVTETHAAPAGRRVTSNNSEPGEDQTPQSLSD